MDTQTHNALRDADLFVLLEKAFRRKSRDCCDCTFTLPFRTDGDGAPLSNWSVIPSEACSPRCKMILEDLVSEFQTSYRLSDTGRFHPVGKLAS